MKSFATNIRSLFSSAQSFGVLWRLTILFLPWQTRWFQDASLGGWPWEQGRWSVYGSMFLLIATIVIGFFCIKREKQEQKADRKWNILFSIAGLIVLTLVTTLSVTATLQWWIQVLLLSGFVFVLLRNAVPTERVMTWFVLSIVPHAALGIWQYLVGDVMAMKWLGIAAHEAAELGTSVVEHGDFRILRAYGGFPHPNIFGGWLAVGILSALSLAANALTKARVLWWSGVLGLFGAALVATYSRSAWIAIVIGIIFFISFQIYNYRSEKREATAFSWQFFAIALLTFIAVSGGVIFAQREHVFARFDVVERLERKSVTTRAQGLAEGWKTFLARPFFGTGPNAELVPLVATCGDKKCIAPLEPPHLVPLLALENLGVVGMAILLFVSFPLWRRVKWGYMPFLGTLGVIAGLDHYLWSTWSGVCLFILVIMLCLAPEKSLDE